MATTSVQKLLRLALLVASLYVGAPAFAAKALTSFYHFPPLVLSLPLVFSSGIDGDTTSWRSSAAERSSKAQTTVLRANGEASLTKPVHLRTRKSLENTVYLDMLLPFTQKPKYQRCPFAFHFTLKEELTSLTEHLFSTHSLLVPLLLRCRSQIPFSTAVASIQSSRGGLLVKSSTVREKDLK